MNLCSIPLYVRVAALQFDADTPHDIQLATTLFVVPVFGQLFIDCNQANFSRDEEYVSLARAVELLRAQPPDGFWVLVDGMLEGYGRIRAVNPDETGWAPVPIHDGTSLFPWQLVISAREVHFIEVASDAKVVEVTDEGGETIS